MPLKTYLLILCAVIGLAAGTIAVVVMLTGSLANPSIGVLAGVSVATLLASLLIRRFDPKKTR